MNVKKVMATGSNFFILLRAFFLLSFLSTIVLTDNGMVYSIINNKFVEEICPEKIDDITCGYEHTLACTSKLFSEIRHQLFY